MDMKHMWASQALVGMKPKGNVDLSAAILFSGSSAAGTLRMMKLMGVQAISDQTFRNYQRAYLFAAGGDATTEYSGAIRLEISYATSTKPSSGMNSTTPYASQYATSVNNVEHAYDYVAACTRSYIVAYSEWEAANRNLARYEAS
ncbi:hypothetical protein HPB49_013245 [Dermacentor silvarum]|uniref:Uncharacterized protein n=1 Tax=Dermacentor silvarum TaxID=543639 RepID=A0ACB8DZS6_DERSI|nr:hypothetical protein HPB49_013245 [Dermacentor silvarum]